MPDFGLEVGIKEIIDFIKALISLMFGGNPPAWLLPTIAWIIASGIIVTGLVFILGRLKVLWNEYLKPLFHNPEQKRLIIRRQHFADHIESEIRRLNILEAWSDYRFAELEAEVEAEGKRRLLSQLRLPGFIRRGLRHERSLSTALEKSEERLILLEGEPGSGKSVALRHVAQRMARSAAKSKNLKTAIPIYVNLKEIDRSPGQQINREFIERFVLKILNRVNDRDIENFLDDHFNQGLQNGTWLFLFDSFDEIPEVLSSTDADELVNLYASAIRDFLHGMNRCRGIVASREYKGPRRLGWPRFRVLRLSSKRREKLIKKGSLPAKAQNKIIGNLELASSDFRTMTSNPMFLGLLCDFLRGGEDAPFPQHTHAVFEQYIEQRLSRDENRLQRRFNKAPKAIRLGAEKLAFCMASEPDLGLSPTRVKLYQATLRHGLSLGEDFETIVDALEFLKLARSETMTLPGDSKPFTFAHRRFQEYFATSTVLREPHRVTPDELITNARWRETAVVLLQTQSIEVSQLLIQTAFEKLEKTALTMGLSIGNVAKREETSKSETIKSLLEKPNFSKLRLVKKVITEHIAEIKHVRKTILDYFKISHIQGGDYQKIILKHPINWPMGLLHILGILQDGLSGSRDIIPNSLQNGIDKILLYTSENGTTFDQKWGLEVSGAASETTLATLIEKGFHSRSQWLNDIAYKQAAKLSNVPKSISTFIHREITNMALEKRLFSHRRETFTHLSRLNNASRYLNTLRLMTLVPILDHFFVIIGIMLLLGSESFKTNKSLVDFLCFITFLILVLRWHSSFFSKFFRNNQGGVGYALALMPLFVFILEFMSGKDTKAILNGQDANILLGVIIFLVVSCFTCWGPAAVFISYSGRFTHPIWWIFYTISPFILFIVVLPFLPYGILLISFIMFTGIEGIIRRGILELSRFSLGKLRDIILHRLKIFVALGAVFVISTIIKKTWDVPLEILIIIPLFSVVLGVLLLGPVYFGVLWAKDLWAYRKWLQTKPSSLTLYELLDVLSCYKTSEIRTRILQRIREQQLLKVLPEVKHSITNLVLFVESIIKIVVHFPSPYISPKAIKQLQGVIKQLQNVDGELAGKLVDKDGHPKKHLHKWSREQLDELYRLLEQVRQLV